VFSHDLIIIKNIKSIETKNLSGFGNLKFDWLMKRSSAHDL